MTLDVSFELLRCLVDVLRRSPALQFFLFFLFSCSLAASFWPSSLCFTLTSLLFSYPSHHLSLSSFGGQGLQLFLAFVGVKAFPFPRLLGGRWAVPLSLFILSLWASGPCPFLSSSCCFFFFFSRRNKCSFSSFLFVSHVAHVTLAVEWRSLSLSLFLSLCFP